MKTQFWIYAFLTARSEKYRKLKHCTWDIKNILSHAYTQYILVIQHKEVVRRTTTRAVMKTYLLGSSNKDEIAIFYTYFGAIIISIFKIDKLE